MQVISNGADLTKRVNWSNRNVLSSVLETLKKQGVKETARKFEVTPNALRQALRRRGLAIHFYKKYKPQHKPADIGFFDASRHLGIDPFLAQDAISNKPDNGCSWPKGDLAKGSFSFCGKPRAHKAYCEPCAKRAYII